MKTLTDQGIDMRAQLQGQNARALFNQLQEEADGLVQAATQRIGTPDPECAAMILGQGREGLGSPDPESAASLLERRMMEERAAKFGHKPAKKVRVKGNRWDIIK